MNNRINFEKIRAIADSESLIFRFSNKETFKNINLKEIFQKLYEISEKLDAKIGINYFKGIKNNIENFYQRRLSELDLKIAKIR